MCGDAEPERREGHDPEILHALACLVRDGSSRAQKLTRAPQQHSDAHRAEADATRLVAVLLPGAEREPERKHGCELENEGIEGHCLAFLPPFLLYRLRKAWR